MATKRELQRENRELERDIETLRARLKENKKLLLNAVTVTEDLLALMAFRERHLFKRRTQRGQGPLAPVRGMRSD
jgi:hypothetical protein